MANNYRFRAYHKDSNHASVVRALAACTIEAWDLSAYGFPADLLITKNGGVAFIEIKDGKKCKSARKLTKNSEEFAKFLKRNGTELFVVNSDEEAVELAKQLVRNGRVEYVASH